MPKVVLDVSVVSLFRSSELGWENLMTVKIRMEEKYRDRATAQRYHIQNIRFDPLDFEYSGGWKPEGDRLLI